MNRPRQAVILAGGRGRRLLPLTDRCPKHMIEVQGRPFLGWLVDQLREQGFERVLLLLGYLPEVTRQYFGDGSNFGVAIDYSITPPDYETGARLRAAAHWLDEVFLLLYCDNYWPFHFSRIWQPFCLEYSRGDVLAQMTVYENLDGYSRSNVRVRDRKLELYDGSRTAEGLNGVDIGYLVSDRRMVDLLSEGNVGLESVYNSGRVGAFVTGHRYYNVGTHQRLSLAGEFFARPRAVLVDRDGVLNRRPAPGDYVRSWADWEWLDGALDALGVFASAGFRVLVISNQAGLARGMVQAAALDEIDRRMKAEAAAAGGRIDASYYCPHHWDDGCRCRKPQPGLLWQAQRDFHLDLTRTWLIGDDDRDAGAAEAAGCRFAQVTASTSLLDLACSRTKDPAWHNAY